MSVELGQCDVLVECVGQPEMVSDQQAAVDAEPEPEHQRREFVVPEYRLRNVLTGKCLMKKAVCLPEMRPR